MSQKSLLARFLNNYPTTFSQTWQALSEACSATTSRMKRPKFNVTQGWR